MSCEVVEVYLVVKGKIRLYLLLIHTIYNYLQPLHPTRAREAFYNQNLKG